MFVQDFVFFDGASAPSPSNAFANPGDISTVTIQVKKLDASATINLSVEGLTDVNNNDSYAPIKVVGLEALKATSTITAEGLYVIPMIGVRKIRMKGTGSTVSNIKVHALSVNG